MADRRDVLLSVLLSSDMGGSFFAALRMSKNLGASLRLPVVTP
jgi:hypothetical protein